MKADGGRNKFKMEGTYEQYQGMLFHHHQVNGGRPPNGHSRTKPELDRQRSGNSESFMTRHEKVVSIHA